MGKYNFAASRVRQTALHQAASGYIKKLPEWAQVIGDIPPAQVVVRNQPQQHQLVHQRLQQGPGESKPRVVFHTPRKPTKSKKASRMFKPVPIQFEEDQLRKEFFRDHPWELARPRILVENSGKDFEQYDWSRIQQPGKKLDGESVVQRQLWLLNNVPNMTKGNAYDIARREFYRIRLREEIQRRVAVEEAQAFGAEFGPSRVDIGMQLEGAEFERWKKWAKAQSEGQRAQEAAGNFEAESSEDALAADPGAGEATE